MNENIQKAGTPFLLGMDIGSVFSKGVLMRGGEVLGSYLCPSGGDLRLAAEKVKDTLLGNAGISPSDVARTVATGFGSQQIPSADETRSDMSCHGKGVFSLLPSVRTIVEVGDLYSRAFRIDGMGNVVQFVLSGKCAGGSGRLLQIIARVLRVKMEEIGALSLRSRKKVEFSTGCVVFAESEAISRIAEGVSKEDLLAGIHRALAGQLNSLAERVGVEMEFAMVGGGAADVGLIRAMEETRSHPILVPPEPRITAALGAAIIAGETLAGC